MPTRHERVQFNAFFAMNLVDCAFMRMIENYSGDCLLETIECETELVPNPGVYQRLTRVRASGSLRKASMVLSSRELSGPNWNRRATGSRIEPRPTAQMSGYA